MQRHSVQQQGSPGSQGSLYTSAKQVSAISEEIMELQCKWYW